MLRVSGANKFYYVRSFTDMRCKYGRLLSVICHHLGREPEAGGSVHRDVDRSPIGTIVHVSG